MVEEGEKEQKDMTVKRGQDPIKLKCTSMNYGKNNKVCEQVHVWLKEQKIKKKISCDQNTVTISLMWKKR